MDRVVDGGCIRPASLSAPHFAITPLTPPPHPCHYHQARPVGSDERRRISPPAGRAL